MCYSKCVAQETDKVVAERAQVLYKSYKSLLSNATLSLWILLNSPALLYLVFLL